MLVDSGRLEDLHGRYDTYTVESESECLYKVVSLAYMCIHKVKSSNGHSSDI